ncbi:Zn-dependent alcohol dehydrogenase [Aeromicrobium endophyticum]|uniref:NDMA-dependent alcohol dehydrogenase n=1 Tax=Aeromicrobium endophyticum TaxID=2292704 RepID=A0A371PBH5_9ACTN|nr:Zn-dependent alcohol dehydrogenase [Aeromicrobium endophyticum]REK73279.1 NDMA-dependent alcohol dehydrogenase [Aeromicrobium endophyticum]
MKTNAAVIHAVGEEWKVQELDLNEPGDNEVRIKVMASGLCHSDDHFVTGDLAVDLPMVGGHEGAGIVEAVGSKVTKVKVGDHVATLFIPACGQCEYCARGMQYICNNGAGMETGMGMDGNAHFHDADGNAVGGVTRLGTFSNYLVCHEMQTVKLPEDIPFELACLASCGVATGFGAAVNGGVKPGDVVLVLGLGGVGANAVQGAKHAGADHIIVIEPVEAKHDQAKVFGATEAYASIPDAQSRIDHLTNGQGVDVALITVGRVDGDIIGDAFRAVGKAGTCVLVSVGQAAEGISISPQDFTNFAKHFQGVMYGNCNPTADIPKLLKMYKDGTLKLDELVTRRYSLDQINEAVDDMHAGRNIRGVVVHEH